MGKQTTPWPTRPTWDPKGYAKAMDRAERIVNRANERLDEGQFWSGVAMGLVGTCYAVGTVLTHPCETIADLCGSGLDDGAERQREDNSKKGNEHV